MGIAARSTPCRGAGFCRRRIGRSRLSRSSGRTFRSARASSRCGDGCGVSPRTLSPAAATGGAWSTAFVPTPGRSGEASPSIPSSASSATRAPGGKCTATAWRRKWSSRSRRRSPRASFASLPRRRSPLCRVPALARITYRRRGSDKTETLDVAKVAECTGVYTDPLATTNPLLKQVIRPKAGAAGSARHRHRRRCRLRHRRPSWARLAGALRRRASDPRRLLGDHGGARYPRAMRRARRPFARAACRTTGAGKAQSYGRSGVTAAMLGAESKAHCNLD